MTQAYFAADSASGPVAGVAFAPVPQSPADSTGPFSPSGSDRMRMVRNQDHRSIRAVRIDGLLKVDLTESVSVLFDHALPDGTQADQAFLG